jgi:P-type conjugative transfer protein TrbJ
MRKALTILLFTGAAFVPVPTQAQVGGGVFVCANCSTEPTSLLQKVELVLQYQQQVQMVADMILNSTKAGPASLTNISGDLNTLAAVVQGSQALAYSLGNQDVLFRQTYPGYQQPAWGASTYANKYALWAATSLATTQGILRGTGVQGKLLQTEQGVLGVLRLLAASNILPRNLAISVTGQLAAEQVGQLQKLRELQLEDMTSKAAFQGYQIQKDADTVGNQQQFFAPSTITGDTRTFSPTGN